MIKFLKYSSTATAAKQLVSLLREGNWEACLVQLERNPDCAKRLVPSVIHNQKTYMLPIHIACSLQTTPLSLLKILVEMYPQSLSIPDFFFQRIPLHWACLKTPSNNMRIDYLLEAYPEGAYQTSLNGRLPLHYIFQGGKLLEKKNIQLLLKYFPDSVRFQDKFDRLPLHCACLCGVSLDIIKMLINDFPQSIYFKTRKGNDPIACANGLPDEDYVHKKSILEYLHSQYDPHVKFPTLNCVVLNNKYYDSVNESQGVEKRKRKVDGFKSCKCIFKSIASAEYC